MKIRRDRETPLAVNIRNPDLAIPLDRSEVKIIALN